MVQGITPAVKSPSSREMLALLLEATGDLDKAEVLNEKLPPWALRASPELIKSFAAAADEALLLEGSVQAYLSDLKDVEGFCREQLRKALAAEFGEGLDVDKDLFWMPQFDRIEIGPPLYRTFSGPARWVSHSLLHAAMQNFTEAEQQVSAFGMPEQAWISTQAKVKPTAIAFAARCRSLDLGKRYQQHLLEVFKPSQPAGASNVEQDIKRLKAAVFKVDIAITRMKGLISEHAYEMLHTFLRRGATTQSGDIVYNGEPLVIQGLDVDQACLWGVVVFSRGSVEKYPTRQCIVYMPGESARCLYEYATFTEFQLYLAIQLKTPAYRKRFTCYIDEASRLAFFQALDEQAPLGVFKQRPITNDFLSFQFQSLLGKLQLDSRILAVPTADVDALEREKRIAGYLDFGLNIANIGAMFIPVLGELMMGVAIGQMLGEVYDGVEDWRAGNKRQAMSHLGNVLLNVAVMAAFAAGTKAFTARMQQTAVADLDGFEAVESAGSRRLWRRDLKPYRQPLEIEGIPSKDGIYRIDGKRYLSHHGYGVEIDFDKEAGHWRILHPTREHAFTPPLEMNAEGGWRHLYERPDEWASTSYVLSRIAPDLRTLGNDRLREVEEITGSPLSRLQYWAQEGQPVSMRFRDQAERFRLEQRIRDVIWALDNGEHATLEHPDILLHALPKLPEWPRQMFLELLDEQGSVVASYPRQPSFAAGHVSLRVSRAELRREGALGAVIAAIGDKEREQLLSGTLPSDGEPVQRLARLVGDWMSTHPAQLFEALYKVYDHPTEPVLELFKERFPQLPVRAAQQLIDQASSVERMRLFSDGRISLRLAQRARETMEHVRVDRACAELFLPGRGLSSDRLATLELLERMPGWPQDFTLELRENSMLGPLLERVGPADANTRRIVVRNNGLHEAFDAKGLSLGQASKAPESLYTACLHALSERHLQAVGLLPSDRNNGFMLRFKYYEQATKDRPAMLRLLKGKPLDPEPTIPCVEASAMEAGAGKAHPSALARKVRKLFPLMSEGQIGRFLDEQGATHLARAESIKALEKQLGTLRATLKSWKLATRGMTHELFTSRTQVADEIENAWRRLTFVVGKGGRSVPGLKLHGMRVGTLPIFPPEVHFDHLRELALTQMDLDDTVVFFLKSFKQLESVDLARNRISRLPEMLSHLPRLKRLIMSFNRLNLTDYTLKKLAAMHGLTTLDLSENPLGGTPDVRGMSKLVNLKLRDAGLRELPEGLEKLTELDYADLRANAIRQLPSALFERHPNFNKVINLRLNPLSSDSEEKVTAYRDRTGVGMGYIDDDIAIMNEFKARELWLPRQSTSKEAIWTGIKDEPEAEPLFHLLAELGDTADAERVREDQKRRVWDVLEAAHDDAELRHRLYAEAGDPRNCDDSAAVRFSSLEVDVAVHRATLDSERGATSAQLLAVGRGVFRLDQLEDLVKEHSAANPLYDPAEVSLAYRTGLVERFSLPGQPRHMRFESLSGVTQTDLDRAATRLRNAEMSPALLDDLVRRGFWVSHLRRGYSDRFEVMNRPFHAEQNTVLERSKSMTDAEFQRQLIEIRQRQQTSETELLKQLTQQEMKSVDLSCRLPRP
ncbi:NEL-type E3 ubiquitin ligase domain-containing protein [Pseudomonas sp.]|uniref:NEL-type E3 ubiquitin ligase domain-containing protein n=1 Tax=Pseudomonas sp. TaxID=306 RepID=UPI0026341BAC|nr:NEL-type E3 ubiquitin ligase domain-containing protein [Pseudomonas sp.]